MLGCGVVALNVWLEETLFLCAIILFLFSEVEMNTVDHVAPRQPFSHQEKRYAAQKFDPYTNNGGTVVAIAGKDYVVMGAGMWLVGREGTLLSRKSQRLHEIVDTSLGGVILAVAGCLAVRMNVFE